MFKIKFGVLKEVRIVTYRNGKSKGLAYVEFENEQFASKALIQTDGMLIGEHQITVAISNPPKRKIKDESDVSDDNKPTPQQQNNPLSSSLGAGSATSSFIPRSQLVGRKKTLNF